MAENITQYESCQQVWGTGGREFKSRRSDQFHQENQGSYATNENATNSQIGPNRVQKSHTGAKSPGKVPESNLRLFHSILMMETAAVTARAIEQANARTWLRLHRPEALEP